MSSLLSALRHESRMVARLVGRELLIALLDLFERVPAACGRARLSPAAILLVLSRMHCHHRLLGVADYAPISVSATARSLGMPFETVRRHVRQLEQAGWVAAGSAQMGAKIVAQVPEPLAEWWTTLAARMDHIVHALHDAGAPLDRARCNTACEEAKTRAALDLVLNGFEVAISLHPRKIDQLVIQLVVNQSAASLADDPQLARIYGLAHTLPPATLRPAISVDLLRKMTGLSPSTLYRVIDAALARGVFERGDGGVRATVDFLGSAGFVEMQTLMSARTALVIEGLAGHSCASCTRH